MKLFIKRGGGVPFVKKVDYEYQGVKYQADLKDGDVIKIFDAGVVEVGQFGEQNNFKVKTRNGEKKLGLNQATINVLVEEFGDDTEAWVGKEVKVILQKKLIAGKKSIIPYLVVEGWKLDSYGELVKGDTNAETMPDEF